MLTNGAPIGAPEAIADSYIDELIAGRQTKDWASYWHDIFQPASGASEPEASADPAPAKPASTYVGTYSNDFFGTVTVFEDGTGKLVMNVGPNGKSSFALEPIEGDVFGWDGGPAAGGTQIPAAFTVVGATATTLALGAPADPPPWAVLTRTD